MGLQPIGDTRGGKLKRINSPLKIRIPVRAAKRQLRETLIYFFFKKKKRVDDSTYPFSDSRLVDLDGTNASLLKVNNLVPES